ncbi:MAG: helix-turn-helix domain-containing protein [Dehalococcoidales bacterium]|jgi:excisionase family DNA binding protein
MEFHDEMKPTLTVKDVAHYLNIHTNTVRRWSDSNILKAYRITPRGDRRFLKEDIERFLVRYDEFNAHKTSRDHQLSFAL